MYLRVTILNHLEILNRPTFEINGNSNCQGFQIYPAPIIHGAPGPYSAKYGFDRYLLHPSFEQFCLIFSNVYQSITVTQSVVLKKHDGVWFPSYFRLNTHTFRFF